MSVRTIGHVRVFETDANGPPLGSERSATDLIGDSYGLDADLIMVPVSRLDPEFFSLRNGMAGAFLQKLVNYSFRVAIVGDISKHVTASKALRDFVYESNSGKQVIFAANVDELEARLTKQ